MKLNDFLKPELLGNKFVAVKGYSEVLDRETNKPVALRLNVSIQDENSDFFMEIDTSEGKYINSYCFYSRNGKQKDLSSRSKQFKHWTI